MNQLNKDLDKIFIKGKNFQMNCFWCSNKDFIVVKKRKLSKNEDKSICYAIDSECKNCQSNETFFINYYQKGSISENIIDC